MEYTILNETILNSLETDKKGNLIAYYMTSPIESPIFASTAEVQKWYNNFETNSDLKYKSHLNFIINKIYIASETTDLSSDAVTERGEIIHSEEYLIFDKHLKTWKK